MSDMQEEKEKAKMAEGNAKEPETAGIHAADDSNIRKQEHLGMASFVLGILSLICSLSIYGIINGSPIVGCVLSIIGLVLGSMARKNSSTKDRLTQAGIVLCIIGLVSCCIVCVFWLVMMVGTQDVCLLA